MPPASLHSSAVDRQELNAIMRDHLALERARVYRRLFVGRFGLLAMTLAAVGIGLHWLSPAATWFSVAICLAVPLWTWISELKCEGRLTRRLDRIQDAPGSVRKS